MVHVQMPRNGKMHGYKEHLQTDLLRQKELELFHMVNLQDNIVNQPKAEFKAFSDLLCNRNLQVQYPSMITYEIFIY